MARLLIYCELVCLTLISAASLADAGRATLPIDLSPLVLGAFYCNIAISGSILWWNSKPRPHRPDGRTRERAWSTLAALILAAATLFATLPLVS